MHGKHVLIQSSELTDLVDHVRQAMNTSKDAWREKKQQHPDRFTSDDVGTRVSDYFVDRVGRPYSSKKLEGIYRRAEYRFARQMPPGYEDEDKKDFSKYGDVVIWFQLLDQVRETRRPDRSSSQTM